MIITGILLFFLGYFIFLAIQSHRGTNPGLSNNQLKPCPKTPNCLCSEYPDDQSHYIPPIKLNTELAELNNKIQQAIQATGGEVHEVRNDYIAATYTTLLFRYVDDFEVRINFDDHLLHIRSASRVGRSDFGANRKRIEAFSRVLNEKI